MSTNHQHARRTSRRHGRGLLLIAAAAGAAAIAGIVSACGVPSESDFVPLAPGDGPFIGVVSTTTTTTRPISEGSVTTTTVRQIGPRPSVTLILTERVDLFFVDGEQLRSADVELGSPAAPPVVVDSLAVGPPIDPGGPAPSPELETFMLPTLVGSVVEEDGIALVDMRGDVFRQLEGNDQSLAVAQLVLTLTRRPGIGQVTFGLDGEPIPVLIPDQLGVSEPGEPLSFDDFASLVADDPYAPPDSTVPTTSGTSAPVTSSPTTVAPTDSIDSTVPATAAATTAPGG